MRADAVRRDDGLGVALHVGQLQQRVPGGIGRYVVELAHALRDTGVSVTTFGTGDPPSEIPAEGYLDLGWPRGALRYELWHRIRRLRLELGVDVVHAPSLAVPPTHEPLVVTVHDLAFLRLPHYFSIRGIRFHERGLALARRDAAAVVVPSEFVATELSSEGFDPERVHVAPHGLQPPAERPADEIDAVLSRHGIDRPYVLSVGTLEPRKGIDTIVRAHALLRRHHPDVALALVGPRGWGPLPKLDRPGIIRLGRVSDDDLDAFYRRAVALAYPSHYEGFGFPVLEAMGRGCPVVTSTATSLPEVVGDAGITVDAGDHDALAAALVTLLDDRQHRSALARAGRERAETFTWARSVAAHLDAYRAAARRHPAGSSG